MKAGPELDKEVAVKVLGLPDIPWDENTPCPYCSEVGRFCGQRSRCFNCNEWYYSPYKYYSEEIGLAWEVVEKICSNPDWNFKMDYRDGYVAFLQSQEQNDGPAWVEDIEYNSWEDSIPEAICVAALKASKAFSGE